MSNNETEEKSSEISHLKFKYGKLEFEIKGTEDFIKKIFDIILEKTQNNFQEDPSISEENIEKELENPELDEVEDDQLLKENAPDTGMPLDKYLLEFDTVTPQNKILAVCLYLIEIAKIEKIRTRDLTKLLSNNKISPIQSVATHLMRLREKGLISIVGKFGEKEAVFTIYRDTIEKVKNLIKKQG